MDRDSLRRAFGQFATGVTVVTTERNGDVHGMTANSFTSVSLEPAIVLVCINKRATIHERLRDTGRFGISVLTGAQIDAADHFAGRTKQLSEIDFEPLGASFVLPDALAQFDCTVSAMHEAADHIIAIGAVASVRFAPGDPLIFHSSRYQRLVNQAPIAVGR